MRSDILNLRWGNGCKYFSMTNYRKPWKKEGNKPTIKLQHNGARRGVAEDSCLDVTLILGYLVINYTNFNYNHKERRELHEM